LKGEKSGEAFEALRDGVLGQIEQNRSRLKRCHIIWTHRIVEKGFVKGRSGTLESLYELWFDSGKIAVKAREQVWEQSDEGAWHARTTAFRSVFNGEDFRRQLKNEKEKSLINVYNDPSFLPYHNWFEVIDWDGGGDLQASREGVFDRFRTEGTIIADGERRLLRLRITNPKTNTGRETEYDLQRGGLLVCRKDFDTQGRILVREERRLEEVQPGLWMPVWVQIAVLDPASGKETLSHEYKVDLSKSEFGEQIAIPEGTFEVPITPDVVVIDTRAGDWAEYTGRSALMPLDELRALVARRRVAE